MPVTGISAEAFVVTEPIPPVDESPVTETLFGIEATAEPTFPVADTPVTFTSEIV